MPFTHKPIVLPELEAITSDSGRVYLTPQGKRYPSITTVLSVMSKKSIAEWRKRVGEEEANRVSKNATEFGSAIHQHVEDYLNNKEVKMASYFEKAAFAALKPRLDKIDNILCQEAPLYSDLLQVAGRTDCIAEYDGKLSIIDFKTSKKIKDVEHIESYFIQGTAYSIMLQEATGIVVPNIVILMTTHDGFSEEYKVKRKDYIIRLKEVIDEYRTSANA